MPVRPVGEDEIVQLLEEFNDLFPALRVRRDDVIHSWAGVRPRTAHSRHPAGGPAVRAHDLASAGAPGYFAYTGGLLMVHRSSGREIVGALGRRLAPSCPARPLIGSARLFPSQADRLQLHGAHGSIDVTGLVYACEQEGVVELGDLLRRRVALGWDEGLGCDVAQDAAMAVRGVMGWTAREAEAKAQHYVAATRHSFGLRS